MSTTLYLVTDPRQPVADWSPVLTHDFGWLDEQGRRYGAAHRIDSWLTLKLRDPRVLMATGGSPTPDAVARIRAFAAAIGIETALAALDREAMRASYDSDRWDALRAHERAV